MNRKSLAYSGLLILALIIVSVMFNQGLVQGVINDADIKLTLLDPQAGTLPQGTLPLTTRDHFLGQPVKFSGNLDFADGEEATVHNVRLVVDGPQPLDVSLPLVAGTHDLSDRPGVTGDLVVTVSLTNVVQLGGTLPLSGTLPNSTLGTGGQFKGTGLGAKISYDISWVPPVFLDPEPEFTLIPEMDVLFAIPQLAAPEDGIGTQLPEKDLVFDIPVVGAPAGTVLPNVDFAFNVPQVTVSSNADPALPDLPNTSLAADGFNIPDLEGLGLIASAPSGVSEFPATSSAFNVPDLAALGLITTAPAGEPDLPSTVSAFAIPGGASPGGIASDGTSIWIISKGTGAGGVDQIVKTSSSGTVDNTFGTSGFLDGPSNNLTGITHLDGSLWVLENQFRCNDDGEPDRCDRNHRIFELPLSSSLPTTEAGWGALTRISTSDQFDDMGGITSQGTGSAGTLWVANKFGWRLYNIGQNGTEVNSYFTNPQVQNIHGLAFSENFLYSANQGNIAQWNTSGERGTDFSTSLTNIRGMTFISRVLYMASTDGNVYKAFVGENVTDDPRGIAYSPSTSSVGEAAWILVDANPFDKLMKVDPSDGSLISNFGTNGFIDAPSAKTEGVTFLNGSLYIIANDSDGRKLFVVNATTGSTSNTYNLETTANVFDDLAGITNDSTNLVVHTRSFFNSIWILDPSNAQVTGQEQAYPCCPSFNGARGLAYHSGRGQYFAANGGSLVNYDDGFEVVSEFSLTDGASPLSGIQGMAFSGDLLLIAHGSGLVSKSFLATNATTTPNGIAFTPSSSTAGKAVWILVDGDPLDKILKVDPATGLLISTFGTNGFVDAPSNKTEGITFLDTGSPTTSFLWVVSNEQFGRKLYKVNINTGAVVTTFNLESTAQIFDDIGGLTNDGTDLVLFGKTFGGAFIVSASDGQRSGIEQAFPCCSSVFGAKGLTYHSERNNYFAAKNDKLLRISSDLNDIVQEQTVLVDGGDGSNIEGLVFDNDVLYVARTDSGTGKVSLGALRTTVTNTPRGVAFSPTGTSVSGTLVGRALWVAVDGEPNDMLLKVDPDAGTLITDFDTDGAVELPDNDSQGVTFFESWLWVVSDGGFGSTLYKISPVTGAVAATIMLNQCPNPCSFFDPPGGISNDGSNLIVYNRNFNQFVYLDTNGEKDEERFVFSTIDGGTAVAYRSGEDQIFAADNTDIVRFVTEGNELFSAGEFDTSATLTDIQGMVFDMGTAGDPQDDLLYIANKGSGEIYTTGIPSAVTNEPLGLAYDALADELYILVEGRGNDHVVVTQSTPDGGGDAVVIRDFPVPSMDAQSITYMNGSLYVSVRDDQFGFGQPEILVLDATTGAEIDTLEVEVFDHILGLSNDGQSLIAIPEFGGPRAVFLDPTDGDEEHTVFFFDPFGFVPDGYEALATRMEDDELEFFPVLDDTVFRFDEIGRLVEDIQVNGPPEPDYRGAVFVGDTLYLADDETGEIHSSGIPVPPTVITTDPRGMATDGTDLYVIVDASPVDKIMKLDTSGNLMTGFGEDGSMDAPGTETDAIAFHNGFLYVVTNDERAVEDGFGGVFVESFPVIYQIDPVTGDELDDFEIFMDQPFGPPDILRSPVGALASDGTFLYAGLDGSEGFFDTWFIVDPSNFGAPAQMVNEFSGVLASMPGFQSFEILSGDLFPENRELLASGPVNGLGQADAIARFNKETGAMSDQFFLPGPIDITGTAYLGLTLFLADDENNEILGTSLPENTIELTTVGEFQGQLLVDVSPNFSTTSTTESPLVDFGVIRNPEVVIGFTDIVPDGGNPEPLVDGFVLTSADTTINGLINDPSIEEVQVGIRLPFTALIKDTVQDGGPNDSNDQWIVDSDIPGDNAEWHIQCARPDRVSSPDCSWRFGGPGEPSFETGARTMGTLTSVDSFEINPGTSLEFFTGFITELGGEHDQKFVEVAPVTFDLQGNPQVGAFQPIAQIVGQGAAGGPVPPNALAEFQFIEIDPLFINPSLVPVFIDLSPFAGQEMAFRFRFDSIDEFANEGEGWYLDDIALSGEGFKAIFVNTELLPTPEEIDGVLFFRSFSTPFELAEGENEVGATGFQPYSPMLADAILVLGFVDQTPPVVSLFGIPNATSNLVQTLQGFVDDATFSSLEIVHNQPGGGSVVIFSTGSPPSGGEFSLPVSLLEGINTFDATVVDGGGLQNTSSLQVLGDITPPTASIEIVTVTSEGEALVGDEFFVTVAAQDNLSGIGSVVDLSNGDPIVPIEDTPAILTEMHGLDTINGNPVTHVQLSEVQTGTPVGENTITVKVVDGAGNEATVTGVLDVVSSRSNRNFFLFPGVNFMGLALIPDDGDPLTTDDSSLDRLMDQDVTNSVNSGLVAALGGTVTLGDVMESTFAFNDAGNFIVHTPGSGAADTLTDMEPFQGMIVKTEETVDVNGTDQDVFEKVIVEGFTAEQSVPIRINIQGVFFRQGQLPPDKTLRTGYNLIAPHVLEDTLFDTVYRGALIPVQLAVSAISFDRRVDASAEGGEIEAEIVEGFVTNSLGDFLKPVLSYWTFVVENPNSATPPTITP